MSLGQAMPSRFLSPFALPSETDGRFRMLMVTAIVLTWSLGAELVEAPSFLLFNFQMMSDNFDVIRESLLRESIDSQKAVALILLKPEIIINYLNIVILQCERIGLAFLHTLFLGLLALTAFLVAPLVVRYQCRAKLLKTEELPRLAAKLRKLAAGAGLQELPKIYWKQGLLDGIVTGGFQRNLLVLAGKPGWLERGWNDLYSAVFLHELGHIVNRDVRKREVARSLWFALLCLSPVAILAFFWIRKPNIDEGIWFLGRLIGTFGVAWALWAELVRAREFYADWRVVNWGYCDALLKRLSLAQAFRKRKHRDWLSNHPSNKDRRKILKNSSPLFRVSNRQALLTGVTLALLVGNLGPVLLDGYFASKIISGIFAAFLSDHFFLFILFSTLEFPLALIVVLILTRWVTDSLGTQVFRSAVADLSTNSQADWGYWRLWKQAFSLAIGIELGLLLTPLQFFGWNRFTPAWFLAVVTFLWFWLVRIRASGRMILGSCPSTPSRVLLTGLSYWFALQLSFFVWPTLLGRIMIANEISGHFPVSGQPESLLSFNFLIETATVVMFLIGLLLSAMATVVGLVLFFFWLFGRRPQKCHFCGEISLYWRMAGTRCEGCGEPLSSWLYLAREGSDH